nr:hypothetical protein CFP56_21670 [Quercus suber]
MLSLLYIFDISAAANHPSIDPEIAASRLRHGHLLHRSPEPYSVARCRARKPSSGRNRALGSPRIAR